MLIHALAIMKYCKEHKKCNGCMFWSDSTACRFRNSSLPRNWNIYGFDGLLKEVQDDEAIYGTADKS
jgi:hypothetical protein